MNELANLNQLVSEIKFFENQAVTSYWEIGKRLSEAKNQLDHGEWLPWIEENLGYSRKTASNLIRVYESYSNGNTSSHLNFSKVLALTSIKDEEERQEFTESHPVDDMTVRELKAEIKEYKASKERETQELKEEISKKDLELNDIKASNERLASELDKAMEYEPEIIEKEVIKEIVPDDYELTKAQLENANKRLEKLMQVNQSLKDKEKLAMSKLESEQANKKIVEDVSGFHYKIAGFIQEVGGLLYLTEYLDDIPKENKKLFLDSARYLREFSEQLYKNIEGYINQNQKGWWMDEKEIENMIYDLENESYCLMKSIDALSIKILPADADAESDHTGSLLAVLRNQSELVYKLAQKINAYTPFKGDLENDWNTKNK